MCVSVSLAFVRVVSTVIDSVVDQLQRYAGVTVCAYVLSSVVALLPCSGVVNRDTVLYQTATRNNY